MTITIVSLNSCKFSECLMLVAYALHSSYKCYMCIPMVTCGVTPSGVTCAYPWLHVVLHVHTHGHMWCYTQWCYMCIPMVTCGVTCTYPMVTAHIAILLHVHTHGYMWCYTQWCYMYIPMVTCGVTPSGVTCTYPWLHVVLHPVVLHVHTHGYMWCYTQWCYMCIPMVTVHTAVVLHVHTHGYMWCYMCIPMVTCGVTPSGVTCAYPWLHVVLHVHTQWLQLI